MPAPMRPLGASAPDRLSLSSVQKHQRKVNHAQKLDEKQEAALESAMQVGRQGGLSHRERAGPSVWASCVAQAPGLPILPVRTAAPQRRRRALLGDCRLTRHLPPSQPRRGAPSS